MADIHAPEKIHHVPFALTRNIATLLISGFGIVVALAWNQFVQKLVSDFIDPYLGKGSGLFSLFIYAVILTFIAVLITMQLSKIEKFFETIEEKRKDHEHHSRKTKT